MEPFNDDPLNEAFALIREPNLPEARKLLVELLRLNDENAEAWFLLSYVVPEHERKEFALRQAIRLKPDYAGAIERLRDLDAGKASALPTLEGEEDQLVEEAEDEAETWDPHEGQIEEAEAAGSSEATPVVLEEDEEAAEKAGAAPGARPFYENELEGGLKEEPEPKRTGGCRRALAVLGLIVLLVLLVGLVVGYGLLDNLSIPGLFGTPGATEAPIEGFRTLPPTWTPGP